ncbi:hypothetical protein ACGYQ5_14410 [Burkholderia pseudomallei]
MNASESAIMSALVSGSLLTQKQIREFAPNAKRIAFNLGRLKARGAIREAGLRHSIERGSEPIYTRSM